MGARRTSFWPLLAAPRWSANPQGYALRTVDIFLVLVLVVLAVPVLVLFSAVALATSSMRRANRILPGRGPAAPPLRWLWSPSAGAVLHRRLRNACQLVGPVAEPALPAKRSFFRRRRPSQVDGLAQLAKDVLQEALFLDDQVIRASHLAHGLPRSQALAALEHQVSGIEDNARRVNQLAARRAQLGRLGSAPALELDQRIAAMEQALRELSPPSTA